MSREIVSGNFVGVSNGTLKDCTCLRIEVPNNALGDVFKRIGNPDASGNSAGVGLRRIFNEPAWDEAEQKEATINIVVTAQMKEAAWEACQGTPCHNEHLAKYLAEKIYKAMRPLDPIDVTSRK